MARSEAGRFDVQGRSAVGSKASLLAALGVALVGCDSVSSLPADSDAETGTLQVTLSAAPADTACLRISVTGGQRTVTSELALAQGEPAHARIDRLPLGLVRVDAAAFAQSCRLLGDEDVAGWVAEEAPVAQIRAGQIAEVALRLIGNGRAEIAIDFEPPAWLPESITPIDVAVIGDTPYGLDQVANFPVLVEAINADETVSQVVHVGDIKSGGTRCDDGYFELIASDFASFDDALIYTPGDNEWTDCHRANNGAYDPLERLDKIREVYFPHPGLALGGRVQEVLTQASYPGFEGYPENQFWVAAGVAFTAVHVVGSANSGLPWYRDDTTGTKLDDPARRETERIARTEAALHWLNQSFQLATVSDTAAVVVFMHADTFSGSPQGFTEVIPLLADLSRDFVRPVLLVEGDSHVYKFEQPLLEGSSAYGIVDPVPNLTWLVVEGSTTSEWVKLHIDVNGLNLPFSWERMPL